MKNLKKVLGGLFVTGLAGATITLGVLYSKQAELFNADALAKKEELEQQLEKEKAEKELALKAKDDAEQKLNQIVSGGEVDLAQCPMREDNIDHKEELNLERQKNLKLESEKDAISERLETTSQELTTVNNKYKALEEQFNKLSARLDGNNSQLAEKSQSIVDLNVEKQQLKEQLDKLMKEVERLNKQEAETIEQSGKLIDKLKAEIEELKSKIKDTFEHYMSKKDGCDLKEPRDDGSYGKVCYDKQGDLEREVWLIGKPDTDSGRRLKEQLEESKKKV